MIFHSKFDINVITFFPFWWNKELFFCPELFFDIKDPCFTVCHLPVSQGHDKRLWVAFALLSTNCLLELVGEVQPHMVPGHGIQLSCRSVWHHPHTNDWRCEMCPDWYWVTRPSKCFDPKSVPAQVSVSSGTEGVENPENHNELIWKQKNGSC